MIKTLFALVFLAILAFTANHFLGGSKGEKGARPTVAVSRGSIHIDAVAVGKVEARFEVPVTASSDGATRHQAVKS